MNKDRLHTYQYVSMMFMLPIIGIFAANMDTGWAEWMAALPAGAALCLVMWAFVRDENSFSAACGAFGRLREPAAAVFWLCFCASSGAVAALVATHAAETIFQSYPAWVVALPIIAGCMAAAMGNISSLGRAGFVFACGVAVMLILTVAVLMLYGRAENAPAEVKPQNMGIVALIMTDTLCGAALMPHSGSRSAAASIAPVLAGGLLVGVFLLAGEMVDESALPVHLGGSFARLSALLEPASQLTVFFVAAYRISVGLAAAREAAVGLLPVRPAGAAAISAGVAAAFSALFLVTGRRDMAIWIFAAEAALLLIGLAAKLLRKRRW